MTAEALKFILKTQDCIFNFFNGNFVGLKMWWGFKFVMVECGDDPNPGQCWQNLQIKKYYLGQNKVTETMTPQPQDPGRKTNRTIVIDEDYLYTQGNKTQVMTQVMTIRAIRGDEQEVKLTQDTTKNTFKIKRGVNKANQHRYERSL